MGCSSAAARGVCKPGLLRESPNRSFGTCSSPGYHVARGAAAVAALRGAGDGSQPLPRCSRVSGEAAEGPALSQPGAEADLHPSVSKCTQIISLLRGTGIRSRQLKEERQQALS